LAVMMFLGAVTHIPEVATGLIGAGFIATAFADSIRYNRRAACLLPVGSPGTGHADVLKLPGTPDSSSTPVREASARSRPD